jgi:hypothetical protein
MKGRIMANTLYEMMLPQRTTLTDTIVRRLRHFNASHYQKMDTGVLKNRIDKLVNSFLQSLEDNPLIFVEYMREIMEQRISEGVLLSEIQIVLDMMEEKTWQLVTSRVPLEDQIKYLSRVTGTIGVAKDQVAQIYLKNVEKTESKIAALQGGADILAGGTVSPPVCEYDVLL